MLRTRVFHENQATREGLHWVARRAVEVLKTRDLHGRQITQEGLDWGHDEVWEIQGGFGDVPILLLLIQSPGRLKQASILLAANLAAGLLCIGADGQLEAVTVHGTAPLTAGLWRIGGGGELGAAIAFGKAGSRFPGGGGERSGLAARRCSEL
jgi:hypothetical protein